MSIASFDFVALVALLALMYYVLPMRVRKWALLAGSAVFWLSCSWQGAAYLVGLAGLVWLCALGIEKWRGRPGLRRALMAGGALLALGIMMLVKERARVGAFLALAWPGLGERVAALAVPLGLSYFTFQGVGYLADVYLGRAQAERNGLKVLLFCGFFPQLAQGPIAAWKQLAPQLDAPHRLESRDMVASAFLMAWGFFKKLVIADRLAPWVGDCRLRWAELPGWQVLAAVAGYTLMLYADFSGGIDIARGAAAALGIRLEENFRRPFFATSVADYWRRWHISLGVWFRTYVLYPLVASRAGVALGRVGKHLLGPKAGRALPGAVAAMAVFLLIGLWHGLSWGALLYGAWFGLLSAMAMLLEGPAKALRRRLGVTKKTRWYRAAGWARTMLAVLVAQFIAWSPSPGVALGMMGRVVTAFGGAGSLKGFDMAEAAVLLAAVAILAVVDMLCERMPDLRHRLADAPIWLRWPLLMGLLLATMVFGKYGAGYDAAAFLYAGF